MKRRTYIRLNAVFPVEFQFLDPKTSAEISDIKQGFTRNISKGGICLEVNNLEESLERILKESNTKLKLTLHIPLGYKEIKATANIAWYEKIKDSHPNQYLIGLAFLNIDPKDRRRIYFHARRISLAPKLVAAIVLLLIISASFFYISDLRSSMKNKKLMREIIQLSVGKIKLEKKILTFDKKQEDIAEKLLENQKKVKDYEERIKELEKMSIELKKKDEILVGFRQDKEEVKKTLKKTLHKKQKLFSSAISLSKETTSLRERIFKLSKDKMSAENNLKKLLSTFELLKNLTDWTKGDHFRLSTIHDREIFIDPIGMPFYSKGMIYAYGHDQGPLKDNLTLERIIEDISIIKSHGFNTLNLYGDKFLDEILTWCDKNKIAVYPRADYTNFSSIQNFSAQYPDFMDPRFRKLAKHSLDKLLTIIRNHHCILAIDIDQRWLFDIDYRGSKRSGIPKLGQKSLKYFPKWLKEKYKDIESLNEMWGKQYSNFEELLDDNDVVIDNYVRNLNKKPWRLDFVEYTLWTINDFLKDITSYIRTIDPYHLITYTSDLPEVIPFPISTLQNSGIDFISPVHFNSEEDFNRDWIGSAEFLYMTKWLHDLYNMPVYINDTGFRTTSLAQNPPNMTYAVAEEYNEAHVAELYFRQMSLMTTCPWIVGWAYFMLYDKLAEGDFGYIRDDGSLKPISFFGQFFNKELSPNMTAEKNPQLWIYYPYYALSSPFPSYQQYKSLVVILEDDFFTQYEALVQKALPNIANPTDKITKIAFLKELNSIFNATWVPFRFTADIPSDKTIIILAGKALEQLSKKDRLLLSAKKTITFGLIGIKNERYHDTEPFCLSVMGIQLNSPIEERITINASITVSMNDTVVSGVSPYVVLLTKEEIGKCNILATFSDNNPAIIQSQDKKHIAFLYDPLTWSGKQEEMSRSVKEHAKIMKEIIKKKLPIYRQ